MKTSTTKRKAIANAVELLKEESPDDPGNIAGVQLIPIEKVRAFKDHPFRLYEESLGGMEGEAPDKNWNLSMDGLMMTENPDTSVYAKQLAEMTAEEPDPQKELLYEKLSELPEEDQELYRLYYTEGYSQEEIADMKGVSQNTVSKKLRRIARQLTEMCRKAR